jgi:hypothetical protein
MQNKNKSSKTSRQMAGRARSVVERTILDKNPTGAIIRIAFELVRFILIVLEIFYSYLQNIRLAARNKK